jgi:DNA-binding CsgD family transcriptional regulator
VTFRNQMACEYSLSLTEKIEELTKDLFSALGLTTFGYKRVFDDGRYIFTSTNPHWLSYHYKNIHDHGIFFKEAMDKTPLNSFYKVLWPKDPKDHFLKSLNDFGMWNGLNFYKRREDSIELWTFSTEAEKHQDPADYLNTIECLERFILYFNSSFDRIIDYKNSATLATFQEWTPIKLPEKDPSQVDPIEAFIQSLKPECLTIKTGAIDCCFTKQESTCIHLLCQGKSAKEIGLDLNLSYRTIEFYLANIRKKSGIHKKSELIQTVQKNCWSLSL